MRAPVIFSCFLLLACGSEPQQTTEAARPADTMTASPAAASMPDTDTVSLTDTTTNQKPVVQAVKRPSGIYRFYLPYEGSQKILHTVAFYPGTFRLQEEYPANRDSIVITEGTWAPSAGYIWLYKDQIVRGRYAWKGDTLQYYSPRSKKAYAMAKLSPASANKVWQTKKKEGAYIYGVGTEPFWSLELTPGDTILLNMPGWNAPLKARLSNTSLARDSTIYSAVSDSLEVTVYPFFCNDGMSDFLYTQKIKVSYKGQLYKGCGEVLSRNH